MSLQAKVDLVKEERGANDAGDADDDVALSLLRGRKKTQNGPPLVRGKTVKVKKEEGNGDGDGDFEEDERPPGGKVLKKEARGKVKKEEPEFGEDEDDGGDWKPPSANASKGGVSNGKRKASKKKADESDEEEGTRVPKKAAGKADKEEKKKKTTSKRLKEEGKSKTNRDSKKSKINKAKKVYDLPGQKHDQPDERDPLRIFYETLHKQLPNSDMAAIWMMERGLLPREEAERVYKRKQSKGPQAKKTMVSVTVKKASRSSASKTVVVSKTVSKSSKRGRRADCTSSDEEDDDFSEPKTRKY